MQSQAKVLQSADILKIVALGKALHHSMKSPSTSEYRKKNETSLEGDFLDDISYVVQGVLASLGCCLHHEMGKEDLRRFFNQIRNKM